MGSRDSLLHQMEWDEGITMPIANAENKALEQEVLETQERIRIEKEELEDVKDLINNLSTHLRNVRCELKDTEALRKARQREMDTETLMVHMAEREQGRLKQEVEKFSREINELETRIVSQVETIHKHGKRVEELKVDFAWGRQEMEDWLMYAAAKADDSKALQEYTRIDDSKIEYLKGMRDHMYETCKKRHTEMEKEKMETEIAQVSLDKAAETFRTLHAERQDIIRMWEECCQAMIRRDHDIQVLMQQNREGKQNIRELQEKSRAKARHLEMQVNENKDLARKIEKTSKALAAQRTSLRNAKEDYLILGDELEALMKLCTRTAMDQHATFAEIEELKMQIRQATYDLSSMKDRNDRLRKKKQDVEDGKLSAEQLANQTDGILKAEEQRKELLLLEVKEARDVVFKQRISIMELNSQRKTLDSDILSNRNTLRNLNSLYMKNDAETLKQSETLYHQDFKTFDLERRILKLEGTDVDEGSRVLVEKIEALKKKLAWKEKQLRTIIDTSRRMDDDRRRLLADLEKITRLDRYLASKDDEQNLHIEVAEKLLKALVNKKHEMMVDTNILKFDVHHLRKLLHGVSGRVTNLSKRKAELELAVKERRLEVVDFQACQRSLLHELELEKKQINSELHSSLAAIGLLKNRYEIMMTAMSGSEGNIKPPAEIYLEMALEKDQLQQRGDDLDVKIQKAEREIRALKNTICLLEARNGQLRLNYHRVPTSGDGKEAQDKDRLEERYRLARDKTKYKQAQINELEKDTATMQATLQSLVRDQAILENNVQVKKNNIESLEWDLTSQEGKIERVTKLNAKSKRELNASEKGSSIERDVQVRQMRDLCKATLTLLGEAGVKNPDIAPLIVQRLEEAKLPCPVALMALRKKTSEHSVVSTVSDIGSPVSPLSLSSFDMQQPPPDNEELWSLAGTISGSALMMIQVEPGLWHSHGAPSPQYGDTSGGDQGTGCQCTTSGMNAESCTCSLEEKPSHTRVGPEDTTSNNDGATPEESMSFHLPGSTQ